MNPILELTPDVINGLEFECTLDLDDMVSISFVSDKLSYKTVRNETKIINSNFYSKRLIYRYLVDQFRKYKEFLKKEMASSQFFNHQMREIDELREVLLKSITETNEKQENVITEIEEAKSEIDLKWRNLEKDVLEKIDNVMKRIEYHLIETGEEQLSGKINELSSTLKEITQEMKLVSKNITTKPDWFNSLLSENKEEK